MHHSSPPLEPPHSSAPLPVPPQINIGAIMQATPSDPQQEATAKDCVQRLKHLKTLYDNELITQEDFETRKSQIVDELTRTTGTSTYVIISSYFLYQYPSFYTYLLLNISISF